MKARLVTAYCWAAPAHECPSVRGIPKGPGMVSFEFRAIDGNGLLVEGFERAASREAAVLALEKRSLLPVAIDVAGGHARSGGIGSVRYQDITGLTEDLAALVVADVGLDRALHLLAQTARGRCKLLLERIRAAVSGGQSLSEALALHPQIFPPSYVRTVASAELAGTLGAALAMIASERRRAQELRASLASAFAYPAVLTVGAIGVLAFVLTFVIPEFSRAMGEFQAQGAAVPVIFRLSDGVTEHRDLLAAAAALIALTGFAGSRNRVLRAGLFDMLSRAPGVRTLVAYERTVTICATLGLLTANGVELSAALRQIAELVSDSRSRRAMEGVVDKVRRGQRLTEALSATDLVPPHGLQILSVGEEAGGIAAAANRVSLLYQQRLDRALARSTAIAAPAILILVSALIAWIIISVVTALLSINEVAI